MYVPHRSIGSWLRLQLLSRFCSSEPGGLPTDGDTNNHRDEGNVNSGPEGPTATSQTILHPTKQVFSDERVGQHVGDQNQPTPIDSGIQR